MLIHKKSSKFQLELNFWHPDTMNYFTILYTALFTLTTSKAISQPSEEEENILDQPNPVSQFPDQDLPHPTYPVSVGKKPERPTAMEAVVVPQNDFHQRPNLVRRLGGGSCPAPASVTRESHITITTSDDACDDAVNKVLVTCGGVAVMARNSPSLDAYSWILNCEPGKFPLQ